MRRISKELKPDEIHRLRVSIKRIKAVYQLLEEFSNGKFNAGKHYSIFKKIFNEAGKLREVQIN